MPNQDMLNRNQPPELPEKKRGRLETILTEILPLLMQGGLGAFGGLGGVGGFQKGVGGIPGGILSTLASVGLATKSRHDMERMMQEEEKRKRELQGRGTLPLMR